MKISAAIREYLIEIEVRKYTPKTVRGYRNSLNLFLRFCEQEAHIQEVEEINLAVVRQFSAFMSQKGRKGSYINGLLKVSKSFIQYCYDEGYLQLETASGIMNMKQSNFFNENSFTFDTSVQSNEKMREVADYVRGRVNAIKNGATQKQESQISVADEIKKFKELLDMGAITQEEFDAKKKQLLGL